MAAPTHQKAYYAVDRHASRGVPFRHLVAHVLELVKGSAWQVGECRFDSGRGLSDSSPMRAAPEGAVLPTVPVRRVTQGPDCTSVTGTLRSGKLLSLRSTTPRSSKVAQPSKPSDGAMCYGESGPAMSSRSRAKRSSVMRCASARD